MRYLYDPYERKAKLVPTHLKYPLTGYVQFQPVTYCHREREQQDALERFTEEVLVMLMEHPRVVFYDATYNAPDTTSINIGRGTLDNVPMHGEWLMDLIPPGMVMMVSYVLLTGGHIYYTGEYVRTQTIDVATRKFFIDEILADL